MSEFKSQAEVWKALLDGKKICSDSGALFYAKYLYFQDGFVVDEHGKKQGYSFDCHEDWSIYKEPKPKTILKPFMVGYATAAGIRFFKNEEQAKDYCTRAGIKLFGPAKGIPDQETEE